VDERVFGRDAELPDPEGPGSLLPAIGTALLGILTGLTLERAHTARQRSWRLLAMGLALVLAGLGLGLVIPVNKPLWTPSYAVLTAGLASLSLAAWYWLIEIRDLGRWFEPLRIYGMNAIAAYVVSRLGANLPKVHVFGKSLYADAIRPILSPANASLLYAALHVLAVYLVVWWMYRRRWLVRF
jgi:predicted acyltransferase